MIVVLITSAIFPVLIRRELDRDGPARSEPELHPESREPA